MPFEKDFGYLRPFLQRLESAAAQLPDPAARAELQALVRGEQERFARIEALLGGAAAGARPAPTARPAEAPGEPRGFALTVGSLRGAR